uniref:Rrf2 family transcriptional regulator n=1 Tax=candidate division WOR-3 bacterium TaxID=2052148 RepID=A0A7V3UZJ3_UNCW3
MVLLYQNKIMAEIFNFSDAVRIGLHATLLLAHSSQRLTIGELAKMLGCSPAHLAKVLGQLEKADVVQAKTGLGGGYLLARPPAEITLLMVYEAIAGKLSVRRCPLAVPVCSGNGCPLGPFFRRFNREVLAQLNKTTLQDIKLKLGVINETKT